MDNRQKIHKLVERMFNVERAMSCLAADLHHTEDFDEASEGLADIALDLLGFPKDNATEMQEKYGEIEGQARPEYVCRDTLHSAWSFDSPTAKDFIREVEKYMCLLESDKKRAIQSKGVTE